MRNKFKAKIYDLLEWFLSSLLGYLAIIAQILGIIILIFIPQLIVQGILLLVGGGFFFFFGDKISDYFLLKSKEALENAPKTESSNSKPGPWSEIEKVKNTKKDKKRNVDNDFTPIGKEIIKHFHDVQKDFLEEGDKELKNSIDKDSLCHLAFFLGDYYEGIDYCSYLYGYIEGAAQSKGITDEKERQLLLMRCVQHFQKTVQNYRATLKLDKKPEIWADKFIEYLQGEIQEDEDATEQYLLGLAEGKSCWDNLQNVTQDYSILKDSEFNKSLELTGLRHQLTLWFSANVLMNQEAMDFLKSI